MSVERRLPKHLPYATGPYTPGCVDFMTEYSKEGLFARIYYPTSLKEICEYASRWPSWIPDKHYIVGFAYVLSIWTFLIKLLFKFIAGNVKIPVVEHGRVHQGIGKMKPIVFSHGLGGTRFFYTTTCCELASYGCIVLALEHRDDSPSMTYYYDSEEHFLKKEPTWVKFRRIKLGAGIHFTERMAQVDKRASECRRALNIFEDLNAGKNIGNILGSDFEFTQFKGLIDFSKPVMMGHSFGGATALLTLGTDDRFKIGIILDPWMFPIKSHTYLPEVIHQPLLFINSQTFHIPANLKSLSKFTRGFDKEIYTIRQTTHENQTDTVHIIGYWLNVFMRKIDKNLATRLNNKLILQFLEKYAGLKVPVKSDEFLHHYTEYIVSDIAIEGVRNRAKKIPKIW